MAWIHCYGVVLMAMLVTIVLTAPPVCIKNEHALHHSGTKQDNSLTLTDYIMALSDKLHHSGTKQGSSLTLTDYIMALSDKLHHSRTKQDSDSCNVATNPCAVYQCPPNKICYLNPVQCVSSNCPPLPACKDQDYDDYS
uniref:Uncharacterized protein n=1 Tax=Timema poppense TaxID=170557 RepID=A0A7R9H6P0_TIMPO|nr:unnamed protein product [Timema poppensis]